MMTSDCPVSGPETERLPQVDVLTSEQEPELQLVINTDTLQDIRQAQAHYIQCVTNFCQSLGGILL